MSGMDASRIAEASQAQAQRMADEERWKPYPDYVNPYATYLNGLFFLLAGHDRGDLDKALDSLRRVRGMSEGNLFLEQDIALAEAWATGAGSRREAEPTVWVIFENGLAPDLAQAGFTAAERAEIKELFRAIFRSGLLFRTALERVTPRATTAPGRRLIEFLQAPTRRGIMRCAPRGRASDDSADTE